MSSSFSHFLHSNAPLLLDGGLATTLESKGAKLKSNLWSADLLIHSPKKIQEAHEDFLAAGSQVISTASYQFSHDSLAAMGVSTADSNELLRLSAQLCQQAIAKVHPNHRGDFFIAASLGPFGAALGDGCEYTGHYGTHKIPQVLQFHRLRIQTLSASNAHVLAFETIPRADEALGIVEQMKEFTKTEFWISFQLRDAEHLANGDSLHDLIQMIQPCKNLAAIGFNCLTPVLATQALSKAKGICQKPILVYPNSGEAYSDGQWSGESCLNEFLDEAKKWIALGAAGIGGCCRTLPRDIADLAELINESASRLPPD